MFQAIQTKYFGPTDVKGSRIKATCAAGSIIMGYRSELNPEQNHVAAANLLIDKLGWRETASFREYIGGTLKDGTYVFAQGECSAFDALKRLSDAVQPLRQGKRDGGTFGSVSIADDAAQAVLNKAVK